MGTINTNRHVRWLAWGATLGALCWGAELGPSWRVAPALADTSAPASSAAASAPSATTPAAASVPLPELPELEPVRHPAPAATAVKELDGRLSQLLSTESQGPLDPAVDVGFLTDGLGPEAVPAIAQRLQELRGALDGGKAENLLEAARKKGRKALRKARRDRDKSQDASDGDWMLFVLALRRTDDDHWRDLLQLYGMLRMLEAVGTTPAVREMVACYSYFGELVRIDLQRAIERLKDKAVPALIEARKHDARRVRRWASRQLDDLGRAIPGEAVSTTDPEVLADVLRAFGRTRDVDATRVVLSFCNSDRVALRQAAREAIAAIGEPAAWQLRDAYQSLTGTKAPRAWSWQRTARELFRLHDAARLAVVYQEMEQGLAAFADGRHGDAVAAFDKVLARFPLFERRAEMVPAYLAQSAELEREDKRDEAMAVLRKALRLAPDGPARAKAESRLATLEAEQLIAEGTPDRFLLKRALELDPQNEKARELLASLEEKSVKRQRRSQRYLAAIIVGLIATIGMVLLARRRPRRPVASAVASGEGAGGAADIPPEPRLDAVASPPPPDSDARPTQPVDTPVPSDALPTRQIADSADAITETLEAPPDADRLPTRRLAEPPESDTVPTTRIGDKPERDDGG